MFNLFVYNSKMERIGLVQNLDSLQWFEEYLGYGEVKLVVGACKQNQELLAIGNYLYNTDSDTIAEIQYREINDDVKNATITVRAVLTISFFGERVVMATEKITDAAQGMLSLARKNLRGLGVTIPSETIITYQLTTQITWGSVLEGFEKIGVSSGLGCKVYFDKYTNTQELKIIQGVDRTNQEDKSTYVGYFGDDIGTLSDIKIIDDCSSYKNVAVVAGQGIGDDRFVIQVGTGIGLKRRELYVDADDISRSYQTATDTGEVDDNGNPIFTYTSNTYTTQEYAELLKARGVEKLAENNKEFKVTAELTDGMINYGKDYFLGDILPLKLSKYGLRISAQVIGVNITYEKSGRTVKAKLSNFNIMQEVQKI